MHLRIWHLPLFCGILDVPIGGEITGKIKLAVLYGALKQKFEQGKRNLNLRLPVQFFAAGPDCMQDGVVMWNVHWMLPVDLCVVGE